MGSPSVKGRTSKLCGARFIPRPVAFVLLLPAVWGPEAIWYLYPVFTLATAILCVGMLKWRYPAWMRQLEKNGWNIDTKD